MEPAPPHPNTPSERGGPIEGSKGRDATTPLRSFWMGGYEGADHLNTHGVALDMASRTGHLARLDEDYARAAALGLRSVRESIGWRLSEPQPHRYDFTRLRAIGTAARRHGIQVVWTLMHYGTPADVSLLDDAMIDRFARFAGAVAEAVGTLSVEAPVYNPINEIGYLAWATSETPLIHPYRSDLDEADPESTESSGYEVKRRLARAVLAAIGTMRRVDPRARFLHVEPLVHVVAPRGHPELRELAARVRDYQWQAWDLIAGRAEPELGGHAAALDLIGVNYYHSGQWEVKTERRLWWHLRDPRRRALSALLGDAWRRYRRPLVIAETGHIGAGRAAWLHEVASEVALARDRGVPVGGICLYPLIDRPDWNDDTHWHHSGLWNVDEEDATRGRRLVQVEFAEALAAWQHCLPRDDAARAGRPALIVLTHRRWAAPRGRLQNLMLELAGHRRVFVVEEPVACGFMAGGDDDALEPRLDRIAQRPGLELLVPRVRPPRRGGPEPDEPGGAGLDVDGWATAAALLGEFARRRGIADADVWLTSPRALPLLAHLVPRSITYDCAGIDAGPDAGGPPGESDLLAIADRVLADTPAQAARLARRHRAVHWLADAVDAERFRQARLAPDTEEADAAWRAQRHIPAPRLGHCGAIDAALDLEAIERLADACPDCHVVMVGAVDAEVADHLPRRRNIHWLGAHPDGRRPWFVAAWDVCLLPLRVDAAGRLACPSQVLEYLAAEKPVVATALPELVRLYGAFVHAAADAEAFARTCEAVLDADPAEHFERALAARAMLAEVSWERTAAQAHRLLAQPAGRRIRPAAAASAEAAGRARA